MKKANSKQILFECLDTYLTNNPVNNEPNKVFKYSQIEIRNPSVKNINEESYESGDELSTIDAKSVKTKKSIDNLIAFCSTVTAKTTIDEYAKYIDIDSATDFFLLNSFIENGDAAFKNMLWGTYDGKKYHLFPYDLDASFGVSNNGGLFNYLSRFDDWSILEDYKGLVGTLNWKLKNQPLFYYLSKRLQDDGLIAARYKELREKGIMSLESIYSLFEDYYNKIGFEGYKEEFKKWAELPSNRESHFDYEHWTWDYSAWSNTQGTWDADKEYKVGDYVEYYSVAAFCKKDNKGKPPVTKLYDEYPRAGGCYVDLKYIYTWCMHRLKGFDKFYNVKM